MAYQNIGAGNKDDAFYRYKMPKLITKIEGRGNGIKTNLVNMVDVAKALARPASYTTKYFGCELGAQSKFDEKTGTSLVNGAHDSAKLAGLLENFIKKYVQCYECGNPETEIVITKSQNINLKCAACGFVSDVDMMDKVTAFMVKNPPEQKKGGKDKKAMRRAEKERLKAGEALDEDKKKSKKDAKKRGNDGAKSAKKKSGSDEDNSPLGSQKDENEDVEEEDDDNVEWQTDTSIEATKQRIKEQLSTVTSEMVMLDHHEEDIKVKSKHSASKKESAVVKQSNGGIDSAEVGQTLNGIKSMDIHDDLFSVFKEHISKGESPQQLQSFMQSLDASPQDIMTSYFGALFEGAVKGFGAAVAKKRKYLATVVHDENSQGTLLKAIEEFCDTARAEAVKEAGIVLKGLYGADILEEDVIIQWYNKGCSSGSNPIWKSVKPLVEWLQTAESESEEE